MYHRSFATLGGTDILSGPWTIPLIVHCHDGKKKGREHERVHCRGGAEQGGNCPYVSSEVGLNWEETAHMFLLRWG